MFRADVADEPLTFDMTGLIGMNFVMTDRETGSRWQQATGAAFEGPLKGKRMLLYPFLLTTWKEWKRQHPDTLALVPEPQLIQAYQRRTQMFRRRRQSGGPTLRVIHEDARLPPREQVMGLEVGEAHKAYPLKQLEQMRVINDQVGTEPVLVVYEASHETITAFSRRLGRQVLTFRARGGSPIELVDTETGSVWDAYGKALEGELRGQELEPLIPLPSFWFSWAEFFPETEIYSAESQ